MSSPQRQFPKPPKADSSSLTQPDTQAIQPEPEPLAEPSMDQHSASTLMMDSSAVPTPDEISPGASSIDPGVPMPTEPPPSPPSVDLADDSLPDDLHSPRQHPIPPASEPMQYRAIGLVRGKYVASEEQFTRGNLITEDGTTIDAVLLGRVMSLVKKHLDLEQNHLWVVYPRTRNKDNDLHVQIVGVWEPEKLNKYPTSESLEDQQSDIEGTVVVAEQDLEDGYFSIRGEVLYQSAEDQRLIVKIQQSPRKGDQEGKSFKLNLIGTVSGKAVGYFWDLNVQRQDNALVVRDGTLIALVPPKKRSAKGDGGKRRPGPGGGGPPRKRWNGPRDGQRQPQGGDRPNVVAPPTRKGPIPKPVKKAKNESNPT